MIRATIRNGRIETETPLNLPDGTEVTVSLVEERRVEADGWDNSPEGIEAWLKWYDSLQPLIFSGEELHALDAGRQARREWEHNQFDGHADKLTSQWQ
ncbi:MAG: hypothetical protein EHM42_05300 [Planctomycetaceae bacterium]|nr:MAG: hypothetical protein EHM42_05300 [Planctomycetaceae bacterium]